MQNTGFKTLLKKEMRMKKKILFLVVSCTSVLFFSSTGFTTNCCCKITCTYERALGGSTTTIAVDQCWDSSEIGSCDPDTACLKVKNLWLTYTNEWSGAGCQEEDPFCPLSLMYGSDNSKLENLRAFRDDTLAKSAVGRKIIQIYYRNAESINAALERSPALRTAAKWALDMIEPMIGKK
jgi:hypothetical protein